MSREGKGRECSPVGVGLHGGVGARRCVVAAAAGREEEAPSTLGEEAPKNPGEEVGEEVPSTLGTASIPLPVGTLCPIRSSFWGSMALNGFTESLESCQSGMKPLVEKRQRGEEMERSEAEEFCELMRKSHDKWQAMNFMFRNAEDFQAREYFKVMETNLMREGITMDMMDVLGSWQIDAMYATLNGRMPPPPPPNVDATVMQRVTTMAQRMPLFVDFTGRLTASPINPDGSETDLIKEEYEALWRDHTQLITMGETYGSFDPRGKEAFLTQMAAIEERWSVWLTRFQLMGKLNPDYLREAQELLAPLGFSIADFNTLLHQAHQAMREDAEREGLQR